MYPQLMNQAARYAPMLQRLMQRGGSFATPLWKAAQLEAPEVNASPMPPQGAPTGPSVPISGPQTGPTNYSAGADPMARILQGHASFAQPSPLDTMQWPSGPVGAPSGSNTQASAPPQVPMPSPRPAEAPQADPMSFFQRNSAMMRDPMTGQFIDPAAGAQAQATGPDLISKMMGYLHNKVS